MYTNATQLDDVVLFYTAPNNAFHEVMHPQRPLWATCRSPTPSHRWRDVKNQGRRLYFIRITSLADL